MSNAWGGHANGRIPASELRACTVITGGGLLLRTDASLALDRLAVLARADGYDVQVTDLYRDYATQVRLKQLWCDRGRCHMAATPGTSNHGWGVAVDNGFGYGPRSFGRWMHANRNLCGEHGWVWPAWAQRASSYEPWHWEYSAAKDRHRNKPAEAPEEDDDMIRMGDSGPEVAQLQRLANGVNYRSYAAGHFPVIAQIKDDGEYGPKTAEAVANALGRAKHYTGVDLGGDPYQQVTPADTAVLAAAAAKLHVTR